MDKISLYVYLLAILTGMATLARHLHRRENRTDNHRGLKMYVHSLSAFTMMALVNFAVTYIFTLGLVKATEYPENILTLLYVLYSVLAAYYYTMLIGACFNLTDREIHRSILPLFAAVQLLSVFASALVLTGRPEFSRIGSFISLRKLDIYSRIVLTAVYIFSLWRTFRMKDSASARAMRYFLVLFITVEAGNFLHHDLFPAWYAGEIRAITNALSFCLPLLFIWFGYRPFMGLYFQNRQINPLMSGRIAGLLEEKGISDRERQIIEGICRGRSNKEIASDLSISLASVKFHSHKIYRKLEIGNRVELCNLIRAG